MAATPHIPCEPESQSSPLQEARSFLPLLQHETAAEIRAQILGGESPDLYRRQTALIFDTLCFWVSLPALRRGRVKLLPRSNGKFKPSALLQAEILKRLRANQSIEAVVRDLHVPRSAVRHVARTHHTSYEKRGRGRRYTPQQIEDLVGKLRAGAVPADLIRKYHVCSETLRKLRRIHLNDIVDRRLLRGYDIEAVKKALAAGMGLSEIVQRFGIDRRPLWDLRKQMGDYEDRRRRKRRIFSEAERAVIVSDIGAGISPRIIARKVRTHHQRIREIQIETGMTPRTPRRFTAAEVEQIHAAIAAGKTDSEIAGRFGCDHRVIWGRRKRMRGPTT